ncbi:MAG: hypothetical protein IJS94_04455, partial [Clostridia bacterium]|nr:hypothetical protein [Clostridia bacterium]
MKKNVRRLNGHGKTESDNDEKLNKRSEVKKPVTNVHAGHRERLKKRFLSEGLGAFEAHNIL